MNTQELQEREEQLQEYRASLEDWDEKLKDSSYDPSEDELRQHADLVENFKRAERQLVIYRSQVDALADSRGANSDRDLERMRERSGPETRTELRARANDGRDVDLAFRAWCLGKPTNTAERNALRRTGVEASAKNITIRLDSEPRFYRDDQTRRVESRAQTTTADVEWIAGGLLVNALERAMLTFGNVRGEATILRTETGGLIEYPTLNDTGNAAALVAEANALSAVDLTSSNVDLNAYTYRTHVLASHEMVQDTGPTGLVQQLGSILGERLARGTNAAFTTGTGSSQPNGIVTASAKVATPATTDAFTVDLLFDLYHGVDPAYRSQAKWMCNDAILSLIRQFRSDSGSGAGTGDYLWGELQFGSPMTLMGKPLVINNDMDSDVTATQDNFILIFGDLRKYLVREVRDVEIRRADELFLANNQVGWFGFYRCDGELLDAGTNPVKCLNVT